jgi:hypothetical protein
MQSRKGLRRNLTSQHYKVETCYQCGQEKQNIETTGTRTHGQISGTVQVSHNGVISA